MPFPFFLILLFLANCSTQYNLITARLSSSESLGQGSKSLNAGVMQTKTYRPTSNLSKVPITLYDSPPENNLTYFIDYTSGLANSLDINFSVGSNLPLFIALKWQIIGEPQTKMASNTFSAALKAGAGFTVVADEFQAQDGTKRKYIMSHSQTEAEFEFGYRPLAPVLIYAGTFRSNFQMGGGFTVGVRDHVAINGTGTGYFAGSRLLLDPMTLGFSASHITYESNRFEKQSDAYLAIDLGLIF